MFTGDVKTIILDTLTDVSGYEVRLIRWQDPNGNSGEWAASSVAGQPTKIRYTTQRTDMTISGMWLLQAYVGNSAGTVASHGEFVRLEVKAPIRPPGP